MLVDHVIPKLTKNEHQTNMMADFIDATNSLIGKEKGMTFYVQKMTIIMMIIITSPLKENEKLLAFENGERKKNNDVRISFKLTHNACELQKKGNCRSLKMLEIIQV